MSPTTFYPCGLSRPSPDSLCVFRREPEGPQEATPSMRRLAEQARQLRGSPPPALKSRGDLTSPELLSVFEDCARRECTGFKETPQGNEELARHRHHPNPPQALTTPTEAFTKPHAQSTLRLKAQPTPGQLRRHPANMTVARLGDVLLPGTVTTLIGRWGETSETSYFTTIVERAPAKKFHHEQPRSVDPDPFEQHQLAYLLHACIARSLKSGTTFGFHLSNLLTEKLVMGIHPQDPLAQT